MGRTKEPRRTEEFLTYTPACEGVDTNIFFEAEPQFDPVFAKLICSECALRDPCLQMALDMNDRHGIWGGLTPSQRDRHKRAARR